MSLSLILIIVLVLLLIGALPSWGHSRSWGYRAERRADADRRRRHRPDADGQNLARTPQRVQTAVSRPGRH